MFKKLKALMSEYKALFLEGVADGRREALDLERPLVDYASGLLGIQDILEVNAIETEKVYARARARARNRQIAADTSAIMRKTDIDLN